MVFLGNAPVVLGSGLVFPLDKSLLLTAPAARKGNEAWYEYMLRVITDWFEVASANLNLGAYSFGISPLAEKVLEAAPPGLKKVSDLPYR